MRLKGINISGFFFNPNIHPYQEYKKRLDTVRDYTNSLELDVIYKDNYELEDFLRNVVYREGERCKYCYYMRLKATVETAKNEGFQLFTTTLLYSKYQKHELIKEICISLQNTYDIEFYYEDFREGWKYGINVSKELGLYRQKYCGCIYSEKERYLKKR
jgi:hypothetical protein